MSIEVATRDKKKIRQFHLGKKRDPGRQVPFLVLHCKRKEHPSTKSSQHFISLKEKSCYRLDVVDGVGNYPLVLKHGAGWKLPPFIYIYIYIYRYLYPFRYPLSHF